jgi:hypothetical protein
MIKPAGGSNIMITARRPKTASGVSVIVMKLRELWGFDP